MPSNYRLSKAAACDISDILEYSYRQFGEAQAIKYRDSLTQCFDMLADMPTLGHECKDLKGNTLRLTHNRHTIYYRPSKGGIFVQRIIHIRKLPLTHL